MAAPAFPQLHVRQVCSVDDLGADERDWLADIAGQHPGWSEAGLAVYVVRQSGVSSKTRYVAIADSTISSGSIVCAETSWTAMQQVIQFGTASAPSDLCAVERLQLAEPGL